MATTPAATTVHWSKGVRERQRALLVMIRESGQLAVSDACSTLNVSVETVRRDLHVLEGQGLVRRAYGCAYPLESSGFETDLARRATEHLPEKHRLAEHAVMHLEDAETLFIDEGFTPQLIAENLPADRQFTVVTASLPVAMTLSTRDNMQVIVLGGSVRGVTLASAGRWARDMLSGFVLDLAFVGANGISPVHGLTTSDPNVAEVKAAAIRAARRKIFVGTHDKFASVSLCRFASVDDFDLMITDDKLASAEARRLVGIGPRLIRV